MFSNEEYSRGTGISYNLCRTRVKAVQRERCGAMSDVAVADTNIDMHEDAARYDTSTMTKIFGAVKPRRDFA